MINKEKEKTLGDKFRQVFLASELWLNGVLKALAGRRAETGRPCRPRASPANGSSGLKKRRCPLFIEFVERETRLSRKVLRQSTCDNYATASRSFRRFLGGSDVALPAVSEQLVCRYAYWLAAQGVCRNTSSCYVRSLRTMYNKAVKRYHVKNSSPFDEVFTGNAPTVKRALSAADLCVIRDAALPEGSPLAICRDIFLFSFYAMGMPFVDVFGLKKSYVRGNSIVYHRVKTGSAVVVAVEPCMQAIIKKYANDCSEYVFPMLHDAQSRLKGRYKAVLSSYNSRLASLSRILSLGMVLTSYVPRHTWASMAYSNGVPLDVISRALGHSNSRTTLIYIKELDGGIIAKANKKIIGKFVAKFSSQKLYT